MGHHQPGQTGGAGLALRLEGEERRSWDQAVVVQPGQQRHDAFVENEAGFLAHPDPTWPRFGRPLLPPHGTNWVRRKSVGQSQTTVTR
jgi:hypothetical protein